METVNSIEVALTNVIRDNGKDIILNARKLLSCLSDYAPKLIKERNIIKIAINAGAYGKILDIIESSVSEQYIAYQTCLKVLEKEYFISTEGANLVMNWIIQALDLFDLCKLVNDKKQQINETNTNDVLTENGVSSKSIDETNNETPILIRGNGWCLTKDFILNLNKIPSFGEDYSRNDEKVMKKLTEILKIHEGIVDTQWGHFEDFAELKEVELPTSLEVIGALSFQNCKKLFSITTTNVIKIEQSAFKNCESLKNVQLSKTVKLIEKDAFKGCPLDYLVVSEDCVVEEGNPEIVRVNVEEFDHVY